MPFFPLFSSIIKNKDTEILSQVIEKIQKQNGNFLLSTPYIPINYSLPRYKKSWSLHRNTGLPERASHLALNNHYYARYLEKEAHGRSLRDGGRDYLKAKKFYSKFSKKNVGEVIHMKGTSWIKINELCRVELWEKHFAL